MKGQLFDLALSFFRDLYHSTKFACYADPLYNIMYFINKTLDTKLANRVLYAIVSLLLTAVSKACP